MGSTPLMAAAAHGHLAIVDELLAIGVDVDAVDARGRSSLIYAIAHNLEACEDELVGADNHCAVLTRLLAAGANRNHQDAEGCSVRAWAEKRGHAEILALIEES